MMMKKMVQIQTKRNRAIAVPRKNLLHAVFASMLGISTYLSLGSFNMENKIHFLCPVPLAIHATSKDWPIFLST